MKLRRNDLFYAIYFLFLVCKTRGTDENELVGSSHEVTVEVNNEHSKEIINQEANENIKEEQDVFSSSSSSSNKKSFENVKHLWGQVQHNEHNNNHSSIHHHHHHHHPSPEPHLSFFKSYNISITNNETPPVVTFPKSSSSGQPTPPAFFEIKDRVLSNHTTGHSYFEQDEALKNSKLAEEKENDELIKQYPLHLPFNDCSKAGISTPPISIKHATFRHLPPPESDVSLLSTTFAPSPNSQLVICLHPIEITTSQGHSKHFNTGDVIWLDDVIGKGHSMKSLDWTKETSHSVLVLTLKQSSHVHSSTIQSPCPVDSIMETEKQANKLILLPSTKRLVFSALGIGLSSTLTYWLGKVAPHVLAVGVGGLGVLLAGTTGVVVGGEKAFDFLRDKYFAWKRQKTQHEQQEQEFLQQEQRQENIISPTNSDLETNSIDDEIIVL